MREKLYKILIILGLTAIVFGIPAFWLSYPLLGDFFNAGQAAGELSVSFLDVGQGDATLIRTPEGHNILIDGGPDIKVITRLSEELPFWDRTIDLMIVSHPHDDHINGLNDVIKRYDVKKAMYTGVVHTSPGYIYWLELIRDYNIPLTIIDRPQTINLGEDCYLEILYPLKSVLGEEVSNLNNSSIIARLIYKDTSFMFTGDAELEVERELLESEVDLRADVLKSGHHGSDTSSSEEFLEAVNPEYAIIPVGEDNTFGHPSRRILKRLERIGARILRTDIEGTIRIISDGKTIKLIIEN